MRLEYLWRLGAIAVLLTTAGNAAAQRPAVARAAFKGIWEPVNYGEDLKLSDVFFVTPEIGWVAGDAGTILHTRDGGAGWIAQLGGDPQSQESAITSLQFLDDQHGWATQGNDLLRTTDGENWQKVGAFQYEWQDYVFTTFETGIYVRKDQIHRSTDGGRTWKQVFACRLKITVQGLAREVSCTVTRVHFPTTEVGYAVSSYVGEKSQFAVMKTTDGGASWHAFLIRDVPVQYNNEVFFFDETHGVVAVDGAVHETRDGGQTWAGVVGTVGYDFRFADPEVGWSIYDRHFAYTTDGGRRWTVRQLAFPARVHGFSIPRRDRAYVVGEHGMVYRYSVIAGSASLPPGALPAPAMPVFDSPLDDGVETVDEEIEELGEEIEAAAADSVADSTGADSTGSFVEECCTQSVNELQSAVDGLTPLVPAFLAKYRNVNLIVAGLQLLGVLPDHVSRVKSALRQLRGARGPAAATSALTELTSAVDELRARTRQAFQQDPISMDGAGGESSAPAEAASVAEPKDSVSSADSGAASATEAAARRRVEEEARKKLEQTKRRVRVRIP